MLMLNLASSMQVQMAMLAYGDHRNFTEHLMVPHEELNGKTLGVIGFGHIGKAVIAVARAMEMNILVATRTPRSDRDGIRFTTQENLLTKSDVVSLHVPLTPQTHHLMNATTFAMMKPGAFLINTARGGLVDEDALIEALRNHEIAGAGLDVQEHEPLADDSPLFGMSNVIVTPHIGWRGLETRQRLVGVVADDIVAFVSGQPKNQVN
jgi:glycerate dehydrogenase